MDGLFELIRDPLGKLVLKRPGQEDVQDVRVRRAFPWSSPQRYVSVRSSEGKELMLIENLDALPAATRQIIEQQFRETSFVPRIIHIQDIDTRFWYHHWRVVTDRGPAEFRVLEREDLRFLGDGRFTVKDADGNIYELPRLDELDEASRRAVEPLL